MPDILPYAVNDRGVIRRHINDLRIGRLNYDDLRLRWSRGLDGHRLLFVGGEVTRRLRLVRRLWIVSITSFCCSMNASPSLMVQSSLEFIMSSVVGKLTSDLTLGSHGCFSNSAANVDLP